MASRNTADRVNYLEFVPSRGVECEKGEDDRFVLLRPKFMKGFFAKFLQPNIPKKYFRVRLDRFGSKTWECIDGKRTVGEIADLLYQQFGDEVEPRYERCSKFINSLHKGAMVTLENKKTREGA